ncbi:hypothetical protein CYMTET_14695 [Cymbomonas tetramitiformis]|uniref:Uncharacterized protein n=1 Tax=Cymbomonas tetramitiformis TaxID=36881 RepID=A0AAE0GFV7_9CHLO|nr:hypothetical protein CYMTET_14695 [Cymbomonas tetramitiformis]
MALMNSLTVGGTIVHFCETPSAFDQITLFFMGDHIECNEGIVGRLNKPAGVLKALAPKFPRSRIVVVRPQRYEQECYAVHEGFLPATTRDGEPLGHPPEAFTALRQLETILRATQSQGRETILVGFSKGGVVLNQVLSELVHLEGLGSAMKEETAGSPDASGGNVHDLKQLEDTAKHISVLHYVDVGLNSRGAYPTDPRVLNVVPQIAASRPFRMAFYGTPRQWEDPRRPFMKAEKDRCLKLLSEAGARCTHRMYYENEPLSLEMHFAIIDDFDPA